MGRLTQQYTQNKQQQTDLIQRQYQYDDAGNLSVFKDGIDASNSWEVRYVYDMVDRLKHTEGNLSENFVFDPAGNLLGQQQGQKQEQQQNNQEGNQPTQADNNAKGNRLSFQGDRKFTYDARGNLIREARGKGGKLETVFAYNLNNQLISVTKNNQTTTYTYDPLGRRVSKQDNFGSTNYLWAGDQLAQEQRNNIKKTYVYEPESFKPVAMVQDDDIYHYHLDHLGTPRELTNTEGKIVWKAQYKTYGNVALKGVEEVENNLRFQGQYFDEETGLHYNRHRYYDPSVGQFTTQDPIGLLGGVNNYQYAPNPISWVDPLGLTCKENEWNTFQKNTAGHYKGSSLTPSSSYQKMKKVQAMENGKRPDPSTYLPQSYIDAHEAKFAGGASYFAPKWALDKFGRDPVGRADGQFVLSKTQMDEILVRTDGDMAQIEKELGIPEGDWQGQEMVVIEITDPKKNNLRISTGNEGGANELWLAGGKLPTGHDEAVTDAIPKGQYKEMSIPDATNNAKRKK